ncbi:MAG: orotidine-5'-phosphate decarboxylase, partial [Acidimicrobiia bacterium]
RPVFADAKLHDIPNTVQRAASRIAAAGARWVTVHAAGGAEMMEAACTGMGGDGVLAVTVLTSMDDPGLSAIGVEGPMLKHVLRLAGLAVSSGVEGAVSSPGEARSIKSTYPELTLFTPGVRPEGVARDDQRRVTTPSAAIEAGADYVVIGRPITRAPDAGVAAREIASSITRIA